MLRMLGVYLGPTDRLYITVKPAPADPLPARLNNSVRQSLRKLFNMSMLETQPAPMDLLTVLGDGVPLESTKRRGDREFFHRKLTDITNVELLRDVLDNITVSAVYHHKDDEHPMHEQASFVVNRGANIIGHLHIDRVADPDYFLEPDSAQRPRLRRAVSSSGLSGVESTDVASMLSKKIPALDTVFISDDRVSLPVVDSNLELAEVRLYDIWAALSVVSQHAPNYKLRNRQCYWFAAVVYFLVTGGEPKKLRDAVVTKEDGDTQKLSAGYWRSLEIVSREQVMRAIAMLRDSYKEEALKLKTQLEKRLEHMQTNSELRAEVFAATATADAATATANVATATANVAIMKADVVTKELEAAREAYAQKELELGATRADKDAADRAIEQLQKEKEELLKRLALLEGGSGVRSAQ